MQQPKTEYAPTYSMYTEGMFYRHGMYVQGYCCYCCSNTACTLYTLWTP